MFSRWHSSFSARQTPFSRETQETRLHTRLQVQVQPKQTYTEAILKLSEYSMLYKCYSSGSFIF